MIQSDLVSALRKLDNMSWNSEESLSLSVAHRLTACGLAFEREVWLNETDRIDYIVGRIGVELKLKGPVSAVTRQLARYAQSERIDSLVLVSTRFAHRVVPKQLNGKAITVVMVGGFL